MKKTYFVVLMVVVLVASMTGTAFATRYDSGYQPFTTSPHGQYDLTTTKCSACHAVHNPGSLSGSSEARLSSETSRNANIGTSEALLRGDIANACSYCHVSNNFPDIKAVYGRVASNYTSATPVNGGFGHTNVTGSFGQTSVRCGDCHQVHGAVNYMASTSDAYMYKKILRDISTGYDPDTPATFAFNGSNVNPNQTNISKWCTGCHFYYETGYNSNSHVMTSTAGGYGNTQAAPDVQGVAVAWFTSAECRSCHMDGVTNQPSAANTGVNNYPHFTAGYRFLREATSSVAASSALRAPTTGPAVNDGACLICHVQNGANGVAMSF